MALEVVTVKKSLSNNFVNLDSYMPGYTIYIYIYKERERERERERKKG